MGESYFLIDRKIQNLAFFRIKSIINNIVVKIPFSCIVSKTEVNLIDFLKNKTNSDLVKIKEECRMVWVD